MTDLVSIVIPTLNRPGPLARAVASGLAQVVADAEVEIIVVDNSEDANASGLVASLASTRERPVRYVQVPRPGVADARNAGVAAARGRWVAFLDDDQEASPQWVAHHVEVARRTGADAVFGAVDARADNDGDHDAGRFEPYFARRIDRADGSDITDLSAHLGTNNSLFDRERCLSRELPFDPSLNATGGEDSLLIKQLVRSGRRFAWAPLASVIEWVPPRRLSWSYVRRRKFLSGQIRVFVHHKIRPVEWSGIGLWMGVGAAQVVIATVAVAALTPFDRARALRWSVTFYAGLGKVLWIRRFRPSLYGRGLVS